MISNTKVDIFQFAKIAALAPPVPGWFTPSLQPPPNRVLIFSTWITFLRSDQRQWIHKYFNDEDGTWHPEFAGKKLKAMVKDHLEAYDKNQKALEEWTNYRDEETLLQWQIYYAGKLFLRVDETLNAPGAK